jgi:PKD repeat protein
MVVIYTDSEGSAVASPTNAGIYTVKVTVDDANNSGSATGTLTINKAQAVITVSGTSQTYDGSAKSATVTTEPAGLNVVISYEGMRWWQRWMMGTTRVAPA